MLAVGAAHDNPAAVAVQQIIMAAPATDQDVQSLHNVRNGAFDYACTV
jgi:hypothetical protein